MWEATGEMTFAFVLAIKAMSGIRKPRVRVRVGGRLLGSTALSITNPIDTKRSSTFTLAAAAVAVVAMANTNTNKNTRAKATSKRTNPCAPPNDIEDMFSDKETQAIRDSLLKWYDIHQRDLPWRERERERDPRPSLNNNNNNKGQEEEEEEEEDEEKRAYRVWVSEVMLQQTTVQTVIAYFNRWMDKWPTLLHLSRASLEEVNEMWAGLGYYRRARYLLEGAKMIIAAGDGFPNNVSSLLKVPGIGKYTAGAIASIAFNEVVPVVDGNVIRVLARLKAISANPKATLTIKKFWNLAAQLVDPCRPGDFNQSLMELGATLCTPSNPSCSSCPVSEQCLALSVSKENDCVRVTDYPSKSLKVKQRHEWSAACVVEILESPCVIDGDQTGKFLMVRRPDEGLLAGLWEFPSVNIGKEADLTMRRKEIDLYLKKSFRLDPKKNCSIVLREDVGEFIHIFTHIRLKVYVELLVVRLKGDLSNFLNEHDKGNKAWKCVDNKILSTVGLTSGVRKVYNMVQKFRHHKLLTDSVPARKKSNKRQRSFRVGKGYPTIIIKS